MNSLVALIVGLLIIGLLLWAVKAAPFIDEGIKKIINIIVIVVVVLWLLSVFFGSGSLPNIRLN
jgi:cation transporter-like permease